MIYAFALASILLAYILPGYALPIGAVYPPPGAMGVILNNARGHPVHISVDWAAKDGPQPDVYYLLQPHTGQFMEAQPGTSPKIYVSSSDNRPTAHVGEKRDHDTAIEVTFNGYEMNTYYDVDLERGFSEPVMCHPVEMEMESSDMEFSNKTSGCLADVLSRCPEHLKHFDPVTGSLDQCRTEDSTENVALRRAMCPNAYVQSDDRQTKTIEKRHGEWIAYSCHED